MVIHTSLEDVVDTTKPINLELNSHQTSTWVVSESQPLKMISIEAYLTEGYRPPASVSGYRATWTLGSLKLHDVSKLSRTLCDA